ncbi:hypothetical protein Hypma_014814 [Hypsizygus marmoreus]|uniref:Uncharacterized protein n=1 Tax=Hypsizygus marmoreus TaxID=39966 RepID=A0A369K9D0_HYPMA|nr:hypothetical protein Hypma_014814 [Hypsizygus marmoreus]
MFASRTFTISALLGATLVSAQLSLSQNCTRALTTIATNPDANACLTPSPLLTLLTSSSSSSSVIEPINNWLTSLCAAPACSNATIAAIVVNATQGCAEDLSGLGLGVDGVDAPALTTIVQRYYPTVRRAVCLKDGNTNCVTQTLTNIEGILGPLSIPNIITLATTGAAGNVTLPTNVTCTTCIKAEYNLLNTEAPGLFGAEETLEDQCGAEFIDGNNPSGITQSASDTTAGADTRGSGALRQTISKALSGVAAIAGVLVLAA